MRGFNYKKAIQALNFFALQDGGNFNKMKAIKLVWLSDRLHLRKYGRTITGDIYFALPHGPVPSTTRDILELNAFSLSEDECCYADEYLVITGKYDYKSNKEPNLKVFSKTDLDILSTINNYYGRYDHYALRDISHKFPEWKKWESKIGKVGSRFLMDYKDFFKDDEGYNPVFHENPEDLELTENIFFRKEIADATF
jgi:uncharacterized phage-associated protein